MSVTEIEELVDEVAREVAEAGDREVTAVFLGERIMERLRDMDEVAYVRFASVYRSFRDVTQFVNELEALLARREGPGQP